MIKNYFFTFIFLSLVSFLGAQAPVMNPIAGPTTVCSSSASVTFTGSASNSPTNFFWSISPTPLSFSSSGPQSQFFSVSFWPLNATYTIYCQATNSFGVSNVVQKVVTVYETPNVSFSGATSFCQGSSTSISASSTMMSASSTLNYFWSPPTGLNTTIGPNVIANPSTNMTYTCTVFNGPCSATNTIALTVNPLPTFSVSSNPTLACVGQTVMITMSGTSSSYTFNGTPLSSNTVIVAPTVNTTYNIIGKTTQGCTGSTAYTQSVGCIGIADPQSPDYSGLKVFPNPGVGWFNITSGFDEHVKIYNELGQVIRELEFRAGEQVAITELRPGIYFVSSERIRIKVIVVE